MKDFRERIDGSLALDWVEVREFREYYFELDEYQYTVIIEDDGEVAEIVFKVESDDIESTHDQIAVGFKAATRVFHTVWAILKYYIENSEDPVDIVEFSAKKGEPSRVKFYRTLAKQLATTYGFDADDVLETDGKYSADEVYFDVPVAS